MSTNIITNGIKDYVIEQRRFFHENPELSWQEFETSKRIRQELDKMGIEYEIVKETGVIGTIKGSKQGKRLGIRADIDALPIKEQSGVAFSSKNDGVMHACGHDAHICILLATVKVLNAMKDKLNGEIKIIFQPAEEYIQDSGAKSDSTIDPILAGTQVVAALQNIVSRENDPLEPQVISVTAFNFWNSKNVIPDTAHLEGTVRAFNNDLRNGFETQIKRSLDGVALTSRAKIELDFHKDTSATINEFASTQLGIKVAKEVFGDGFISDFPLQMGGEDFAKYLINTPGCLLFLGGAGKAGKFAQHSENFQIDEAALPLWVQYFVQYAIEYLN